MSVPVVTKWRAALVIKYGDTLHFHCKLSNLLAINSWKWNEASGEPTARFCIEYTMAGATVVCEYDTEEHWRAILAGLEQIL